MAGARRRAGLAALDTDGKKLDTGKDMTVTGKGQLDVKVSAPPGTKVSASGDGLLKDTRVQQEVQMSHASKGADAETDRPY